jgi:GcrA cell cycle regulator
LSDVKWSAPAVEALTNLWNGGYSAAAITKILNRDFQEVLSGTVTRGGVLGKARRLGLESRKGIQSHHYLGSGDKGGRVPKPKTARAEKQPVTDEPTPEPNQDEPPKPPQIEPPKPSVEEEPEFVDENHVVTAVMNLKDGFCKWPIGLVKDKDFHFCGEPVTGEGPYCEHHTVTAHRVTMQRGKRVKDCSGFSPDL